MEIAWLAAFADVPEHQVDVAVRFWTAVTQTESLTPRGLNAQFLPLSAGLPGDEDPYLWVQRVMRSAGHGDWHPDLYVQGLDDAVDEAIELGAQTTRVVPYLVSLKSPAGQPFCLVAADGAYHRALPRKWPTGHTSLLDQLSFDIPAEAFADESRFWSSLTGWERYPSSLPEFDRLTRPDNIPLQILLQRLGPDETGPARAHVDLSCDDVTAERLRHEALGATTVRITAEWTTLRDPSGLLYCITARDPAAG